MKIICRNGNLMLNLLSRKLHFLFPALLMLLAAAMLFSACKHDASQSYVQRLDYTESLEKIDQPDQGFYRPIYVRMTPDGISYNKNIISDHTRLYHLRTDISAFSQNRGGEDAPLSEAALSGLRECLDYLKERDKNAIVRFAYDANYGGKANSEPDMELLIAHAEQFCAVLKEYPSVITAVEAGMFGPWGEMHTSKIATPQNIARLTDTLLQHAQGLPVLVRTPKMIYDYLGISASEIENPDYRIPEKAYRLGIFNDGYLGSSSDLGTYSDRERDIAFLSKQTAHLPYGGEVVVPDSSLHDIDTCLPEMYRIHLSYLNLEWNNQVIEKWNHSTVSPECAGAETIYHGRTAFEYIQNHMGYRFVLKNSVFEYAKTCENLNINLMLENVGFGNLNKPKKAKILIVNENGETIEEHPIADFNGATEIQAKISPRLSSGTYHVYLQLFGDMLNGEPRYTLQFANNGIYHADLNANRLGTITVLR